MGAQYAVAEDHGAAYLRQRVADQVRSSPSPDYDHLAEPHGLLARLPLPVYLTTNYDGFMSEALRNAGKRPRPAVCPWYVGAPPHPLNGGGTFPSPDEPVVYHLNGSADEPRSLVVTEE
nr:SIR2 family protein [Micromonospora sp. DSM 115978]